MNGVPLGKVTRRSKVTVIIAHEVAKEGLPRLTVIIALEVVTEGLPRRTVLIVLENMEVKLAQSKVTVVIAPEMTKEELPPSTATVIMALGKLREGLVRLKVTAIIVPVKMTG